MDHGRDAEVTSLEDLGLYGRVFSLGRHHVVVPSGAAVNFLGRRGGLSLHATRSVLRRHAVAVLLGLLEVGQPNLLLEGHAATLVRRAAPSHATAINRWCTIGARASLSSLGIGSAVLMVRVRRCCFR